MNPMVPLPRSHCLKPRGIVARSQWSAKLRSLARRFARILRAMEAAAEELMASDDEAIHQKRRQGRELLSCFQLPLVAGVVGVKLPKSHEKIWADAVAYPFQRPQGSVRTWHVWVDRFFHGIFTAFGQAGVSIEDSICQFGLRILEGFRFPSLLGEMRAF